MAGEGVEGNIKSHLFATTMTARVEKVVHEHIIRTFEGFTLFFFSRLVFFPLFFSSLRDSFRVSSPSVAKSTRYHYLGVELNSKGSHIRKKNTRGRISVLFEMAISAPFLLPLAYFLSHTWLFLLLEKSGQVT